MKVTHSIWFVDELLRTSSLVCGETSALHDDPTLYLTNMKPRAKVFLKVPTASASVIGITQMSRLIRLLLSFGK